MTDYDDVVVGGADDDAKGVKDVGDGVLGGDCDGGDLDAGDLAGEDGGYDGDGL